MPKNWKLINKIILILLLISCFSGCAEKTEINKNEVTVCLIQGDHFIARSYVNKAERGEDITFRFTLFEGYELGSCSYGDYSISQTETDGTLVLHNVQYSCRVSVECFLPLTTITYDYNGGVTEGKTQESVTYKKTAHPRTNTAIAENLKREGYCLTGWNTAANGSGEHIGLGSRITTDGISVLTLYAQWEKENEATDFLYKETEGGIILTKYIGTGADKLVIPANITGKKVVGIGGGFAEDKDFTGLVLPDSIEQIEEKAFINCDIKEIFFFDNILQVSDESFSNMIPHTWHVNARLTPRYMGSSDISVFADKMDLLILNADKQKIILFAGCSMFYGMDSGIIAAEYPEYAVLNMGAVGGTNATFQFDLITAFVQPGDIFVHAPEQASAYQLMADLTCENRVFIAVEGNYDLLTLTDMSKLTGAFDCFNAFSYNRRKLEDKSYEDSFAINEYGDNAEYRERLGEGKIFDEEYGLYDNLLTEENLSVLCDYYDALTANGAMVYVSYAPINELCVTAESVESFSDKLSKGLAGRGYSVISNLSDYVMAARRFYDKDYHLTTEGAKIRAKRLTEDLQRVIK